MTEDKLPELPPEITAILLFRDPTPNAIIVNRIAKRAIEIAQKYSDLSLQEQSDFFDLTLLICRKLVGVWKHLQAYKAGEDALVAKFEAGEKYPVYSQDLFLEFDEFTVQTKSTLDHVVKVLRPMLGRKWNIATFADKGEAVLNSLHNLGAAFEGRVKSIELICFNDDYKGWLDAIIDARNRVNHYQSGGLKIQNFAVGRDADGTIGVPRWSDVQTLRDAMEASWTKLFAFTEFFVVYAINFRMPEKYGMTYLRQAIKSPDSSFKVMSKSLADLMIKGLGAKPL